MANEAIDYINRDIVNVKSELQTISKLVRDGNGQPSLIQQVATLHNEINHLDTKLSGQFQELSKNLEEMQKTNAEGANLSWQFKAVIAAAIISSFTSLIIHFTSTKHDELMVQIIEKLDKLPASKNPSR
jgi:hypothetical protein